MSTEKTLATVKHGRCVQLATVPYDRARELIGDAYNAGTHGIGYSQQAMELHDAVITAQPSPGASVPAGWKLVPIEPTWSMRNDGRELLIDGIEKEPERLAYFLWKTMINAAPEVQ